MIRALRPFRPHKDIRVTNALHADYLMNRELTKFNLDDLNLPGAEQLDSIRDSFNHLPIDKYNDEAIKSRLRVDCISPTRFRRFAAFDVTIDGNEAIIECNDTQSFRQNVDDYRMNERVFHPLEPEIRGSPFLCSFIARFAFLVNTIDPGSSSYSVSLHQVRQVSYPHIAASNSPEGVHRDGADYIVSACILNKFNVKGGESIVFHENKEDVLYQTVLGVNEGIFQRDTRLWHTVTPIECDDDNYIAVRDLIGMDFNIQT